MEVIRRGDLVTVALSGDYGRPRPALVVQSDAFAGVPSLTVLRITSDLNDWPLFRITVEPSSGNGLKSISQIMVDKIATLPRKKVGQRIGMLDASVLRRVDDALRDFLQLGWSKQ